MLDGIVREIPDNYTLDRVRESRRMRNITVVTKDLFATYKVGPKLETLGPPKNADEVTRNS